MKKKSTASAAFLTGDETEFFGMDSNCHEWDFLGETYSQTTKCRNADDSTDIDNRGEGSSVVESFSNSNENDAELGSMLTTEDEVDVESGELDPTQRTSMTDSTLPIPVPLKKATHQTISMFDATPRVSTSFSNPDLSYSGTIVSEALLGSSAWNKNLKSTSSAVVKARKVSRMSSNGRYENNFCVLNFIAPLCSKMIHLLHGILLGTSKRSRNFLLTS